MKEFDEYLYRYCLHDCQMDQMIIEKDGICFCFYTGIYEWNADGSIQQKTESCKIKLMIAEFDSYQAWEHMQIYEVRKQKITEIECSIFEKALKNDRFDIEVNYFSPFCNQILIVGYISDAKYQIVVSEIKKITFCF